MKSTAFIRKLFRKEKITIVMHIFYEDEAAPILEALSNIKSNYDLYVTHSNELSENTISILRSNSVRPRLLRVENKGMDVYPFLVALERFRLFDGRLICKLHTKRGDGEIGQVWRDELLGATIGDGSLATKNAEFLRAHPNVAMLGAESVYLSAHQAMKENRDDVEFINSGWLKSDTKTDWGFFAGTMFWARSEVFKSLPRTCEIEERFAQGSTKGDGELAHALERIFGILPRHVGGDVATVTQNAQSIKINPPPSRQAISQIMRAIKGAPVQ